MHKKPYFMQYEMFYEYKEILFYIKYKLIYHFIQNVIDVSIDL